MVGIDRINTVDLNQLELFEIYDLAEAGTSILSKFRFIIPSNLTISEFKHKNMEIWPPRFKYRTLSNRQQNYLQNKRINPYKGRLDFYQIPYAKYENLKHTFTPIDSTQFIILKNYFAFEKTRIMSKVSRKNGNTDLEIVICTREPIPESITPRDTFDRKRISFLQHRGDVLWKFRYGNLKVKMPSFIVPTLFYTLNLFKSCPISRIERRTYYSQGIKPRNFILEKNTKKFKIISKISIKNLSILVNNKNILNISQNIQHSYELEKINVENVNSIHNKIRIAMK